MTVVLRTPVVAELDQVVTALRGWQHDGAPVQLHPGDLGWFARHGVDPLAAAVRTWTRDDEVVAVGLLDGATLLRLALAPGAQRDEAVARQVVADVTAPERGVLPAGEVSVESPPGALVHDVLGESGFDLDDPWSLLRRDLRDPVPDAGLRVEVVGPDDATPWATVLASAFEGPPPTAESARNRWEAMAAAPPFADAGCLLARDDRGAAVAAVTVWGAGPGRYGLLEPMGVHQDHQGRGHGRAIVLAAAAALRRRGASAALVVTPSSLVGAVATYQSAGFELLGQRTDRRRAG